MSKRDGRPTRKAARKAARRAGRRLRKDAVTRWIERVTRPATRTIRRIGTL